MTNPSDELVRRWQDIRARMEAVPEDTPYIDVFADAVEWAADAIQAADTIDRLTSTGEAVAVGWRWPHTNGGWNYWWGPTPPPYADRLAVKPSPLYASPREGHVEVPVEPFCYVRVEPDRLGDMHNAPEQGYTDFSDDPKPGYQPLYLGHPPASREEGLRDAETVEFAMQFESGCRDCADADGTCPSSGMPCDHVQRLAVVRHTIRAVNYGLANGFLIPTKPEAKEEGFPWEISPDAWRQVVERIVKETERVYGPGPVVNAVRAALQSKKPE